MSSIEKPQLSSFLQEGRTNVYLDVMASDQRQRDAIAEQISLLHPIRSLFDRQRVKRINHRLERFSMIVAESRADDILIEEANAKAEEAAQALNNDAASEDAVTIVDDSRLAGGNSPDLVLQDNPPATGTLI